jgi:two-component system, NarL family, response regulator YdfI
MSNAAAGTRIRVSISASSAIRRAGLESIIANSSITQLVGSMHGIDALERHLRQFQPDVVVADLEHADSRWISHAPGLDEEQGAVNVLALIDAPGIGWVTRALRANVKAILNRDAPPEDIVGAIESTYSGLVVLEPDVIETVLGGLRLTTADSLKALSQALTEREIQVLQLLAEGVGNKVIATRLNISEHTVKFHISSVLSKMGAASRTEAVTQGIRNGLILI